MTRRPLVQIGACWPDAARPRFGTHLGIYRMASPSGVAVGPPMTCAACDYPITPVRGLGQFLPEILCGVCTEWAEKYPLALAATAARLRARLNRARGCQ